ncbi:MAG: nucleotidyl transferase AbiEii/AbiGii toxin family protein, partial [Gammaproteobacteria bacterium]
KYKYKLILKFAKQMSLEATTIEKDYALSWLLWGISKNTELSKWLFKGGTCLKKCYFETHRFSEDLDFTVPKDAIYSKSGIQEALSEISKTVLEEVGLNLEARPIEIKENFNKNRDLTYICKYTYLGPLNITSRSQPRIKLDLTNDEIIVDDFDIRTVFHFYSDKPNPEAKIRCYSINDILAEKTRALYERQGRARDVYDLVNISRNFREHVDPKKARHALFEKFRFKKNLPRPSVDLLYSLIDLETLRSAWKGQLGHELQILPPVEDFFYELKEALSWWMEE